MKIRKVTAISFGFGLLFGSMMVSASSDRFSTGADTRAPLSTEDILERSSSNSSAVITVKDLDYTADSDAGTLFSAHSSIIRKPINDAALKTNMYAGFVQTLRGDTNYINSMKQALLNDSQFRESVAPATAGLTPASVWVSPSANLMRVDIQSMVLNSSLRTDCHRHLKILSYAANPQATNGASLRWLSGNSAMDSFGWRTNTNSNAQNPSRVQCVGYK